MGTIFEASHVPTNLWLQAIHLLCSSKKGISSNQLHRTLGVTLKTAWFMSHCVREAMRDDTLAGFGVGGGVVEVDETFIGNERTTSMVVDDLKAPTSLPFPGSVANSDQGQAGLSGWIVANQVRLKARCTKLTSPATPGR